LASLKARPGWRWHNCKIRTGSKDSIFAIKGLNPRGKLLKER
jgi:hypothetical protein